MEKETHGSIIKRFVSVIPVYFLGMVFIFFVIFLGMGTLEYLVGKYLNWNIFLGTEISSHTRHNIEAFIWVVTKFMFVSTNIYLLYLSAKVLKVIRPKTKDVVTPKKINVKLGIIYGVIGFLFSLIPLAMIIITYYFIVRLAALKYYPSHGFTVTDKVVFEIVPFLWDFITILIFTISGVKSGNRL